jgi:hypothetical protein
MVMMSVNTWGFENRYPFPIPITTNTMSDKLSALRQLIDVMDLDVYDTVTLIAHLKKSMEPTNPFKVGDTVQTRTRHNNGKGYVHKTRDAQVLVRYKDVFFEEWLHHSDIKSRPVELTDLP